jgi:hypothetical protein
MPTPLNKKLYESVKAEADRIYSKSSAYKSGWIVKTYKKLGGTYKEDGKPQNLKRWFKDEKWININPLLGKTGYPVYRPTIRANKNTPLTVSEIDKKNLKEQYKLKQEYKGFKNLPPFRAKDV